MLCTGVALLPAVKGDHSSNVETISSNVDPAIESAERSVFNKEMQDVRFPSKVVDTTFDQVEYQVG